MADEGESKIKEKEIEEIERELRYFELKA